MFPKVPTVSKSRKNSMKFNVFSNILLLIVNAACLSYLASFAKLEASFN